MTMNCMLTQFNITSGGMFDLWTLDTNYKLPEKKRDREIFVTLKICPISLFL